LKERQFEIEEAKKLFLVNQKKENNLNSNINSFLNNTLNVNIY